MLQGLVSAARDRKIKLRVVSDVKNGPYNDTVDLINAGLYHVMSTIIIRERCCTPFNILLVGS